MPLSFFRRFRSEPTKAPRNEVAQDLVSPAVGETETDVGPETVAPDPRPIFLLGVGAQKAGTSWLWSYLYDHPQCSMGHIKEYAIFDSLYRPDIFESRHAMRLDELIERLVKRRQLLKGDTPPGMDQELVALMDNVVMEIDRSRYLPHFSRLLNLQPDVRLVGDITPEYAGLSPKNFRSIRSQLIDAGYRVRVVFLMRDPVERCYSMLRMSDRNRSMQAKPVRSPAQERFVHEAQQPWAEVRTRYDRTISALEAAFQPDELHFDFYETFISGDGVVRICDFLELDWHPPNLQHLANYSPRLAELTDESIATIRDFYDPVYQFCAERFGEDHINAIWPHARRA